jgi:hypothetical protein
MPFSNLDRNRLLKELLPAVQKNCWISDAAHSGYYSLCGLFLRLKDQFLWEQDLPPWTELDKSGLMEWIEARENLWLSHLDLPFENLSLQGRVFGVLDNQPVNDRLLSLGLYYGAGLGRGLKPTFFLGEVIDQRKLGGYTVITLDREYASDLLVTPAVRRGKWIILRLRPLRFLLWGKIQEIEHLEREATKAALTYYGWEPDQPPGGQLERLVREEVEAVLFHEIGEGRDRTLPFRFWTNLLRLFPHSRMEIYLRSLKDLLGDTHPSGPLRHIVQNRKAGSWAFYVSNLKGMARLIVPEIISAFYEFQKSQDWATIEKTRRLTRRRLIARGLRIRTLATETLPGNPERFQQAFEQEFLKPLKI